MKRLFLLLSIFIVAGIIGCLLYSPSPALPPVHRIVCFGDSLTYGQGAGPGEDYPSILEKILQVEVINAGIPGQTTEDALKRVEEIIDLEPDLVIILLGGNDLFHRIPLEETEKNIREIVYRIKEEKISVLLISPLTYFDRSYLRIARQTSSLFIPHLLRYVLHHPELKYDEVHPNGNGYRWIANKIARFLKPYLRRGGEESSLDHRR